MKESERKIRYQETERRTTMLIDTYIRINDNMSYEEKKIAVQAIVKVVDAAILNNEESCKFRVGFERRLDDSRMFHKTPYDRFGIRDDLLFDSVVEKKFLEISNSIKVKVVNPNATTLKNEISMEGSFYRRCINYRHASISKGQRGTLILIATPTSEYRRERLAQYSDRRFMTKILSEHNAILEKIYEYLKGNGATYGKELRASCSFIGPYSDCDEYCMHFSKLGMNNLKDSFQTYQMTLAFIKFLNNKGIECGVPQAKFVSHSYDSHEIVFDFIVKESVKSNVQRRDW